MSDRIMKESGEPFASIEAAKSKRTRMGEEGQDTNIIEVEGGYALEKKGPIRPKRIPVGRRNRLTMDKKDKDPNYVYRIVNDDPGRVDMFKDAWWEVVTDKVQIGEDRIEDASQMGSVATKTVGRDQTGVVMRIKRELYEKDQRAKSEKIEESMKEIQREPNKPGQYGKIKITDNPRG